MANIKIAIDFVLRQEDARMTGAVTTIKGDRGGPTRFGIASRFHPELIRMGFFNAAQVPAVQALAIAEHVYNVQYAEPLQVATITDQAVATAVLSFGLNAGVSKAAKFLQMAASQFGHLLVVDGEMGPSSVAAVNHEDPDKLLAGFAAMARRFYIALASTVPADAPDLKGWLNRANAWQANAVLLRQQAASPGNSPARV